MYDKRDDFYFYIVNFPFWDGDVRRAPSFGVFMSQLIRFITKPLLFKYTENLPPKMKIFR